MQARSMIGWEIQDDDFIIVDGEVYQVIGFSDQGNLIHVDARYEDGEKANLRPLDPFETIELITSFED